MVCRFRKHKYEDIAVDQSYSTYRIMEDGTKVDFNHTVKFIRCVRCGHRDVSYEDEIKRQKVNAQCHGALQEKIGKWRTTGIINKDDKLIYINKDYEPKDSLEIDIKTVHEAHKSFIKQNPTLKKMFNDLEVMIKLAK